jgi:transcription elongation factor Elf1
MDCPRCGGDLDRYTLGDRTAVGCASCGYAGVPVEHRGERTRVTTWSEAIARYADAASTGSVTVKTVDGEPELEVVLNSDPRSKASDPEPTVVRIDSPDPALAATFEAVDGGGTLACAVCESTFETRDALYDHLAVHSGMDPESEDV